MSVDQWMREGIEAARNGDKAKARELFEKIVEQQENNEKAWFWLASVMDTDEEKRICLANVLQINPDNERAKQAMAKLEEKMSKTKADEEVIPGVTRRQMILYVGGAAVLVVLVVALVVIISIGAGNQRAAAETAAFEIASSQTAIVVTAVAAADQATQTAFASITPTQVQIPTRDLPATWTPTPDDSGLVVAGRATLPPPAGLTGLLVGWRGRDVRGENYLNPVIYRLDQPGQFQLVYTTTDFEVLAKDVTIDPTGARLMYTRYSSNDGTNFVELSGLNGSGRELLSERWRTVFSTFILNPQHAQYTLDGSKIVFSGEITDMSGGGSLGGVITTQLFVLNLNVPVVPTTPPDLPTPDPATLPQVIRRVTTDTALYSFPSWSPDGTRIAAVRRAESGVDVGTDIVIIDAATGTFTQFTSDGDSFIESDVRWSPDGTYIAYAAAAQGGATHDIIVLPASPSGAIVPLIVARDPDPAVDDVRPVWSPDSAWLVFSSNRNGNYDLFVFNMGAQQIFQLTDSLEEDYPGAWFIPQ